MLANEGEIKTVAHNVGHAPGADEVELVRHPMRQGERPAVVVGTGALLVVEDCALTKCAATETRAKNLRIVIMS